MTSAELISALRACGSQSLSVTLHFIADRIPELTLSDGQHLNDGTDMIACLRELARCAEVRDLPHALPVCMKCFHRHEKQDECGVDLGKGGKCDCKVEVSA